MSREVEIATRTAGYLRAASLAEVQAAGCLTVQIGGHTTVCRRRKGLCPRQHTLLRGTPAATHVLVAAARYLAAHAPTVRAQGQTYRIAQRLHHGELLFEEP